MYALIIVFDARPAPRCYLYPTEDDAYNAFIILTAAMEANKKSVILASSTGEILVSQLDKILTASYYHLDADIVFDFHKVEGRINGIEAWAKRQEENKPFD